MPRHCFRTLKVHVSVETVLADHAAVGGLRRHGERLVGPCPIHHGDNPRAFVATTTLWHCFTRCGGGDVVELVRRLTGWDYQRIAGYLATLAESAPVRAPLERSPPAATASFRPFTRTLQLDAEAALLQHKGITVATARCFEAGLYHGPGFLAGCLGVRLHDPCGQPLGYAGRRLDPEQARRYGKWKMPPRLPKATLLYNFHRLSLPLTQPLVVVECPWAVMRLAQIGWPAVALLGTQLSQVQKRLLLQAPRLILMLDGDRAGREATEQFAQTLASQASVHAVFLPEPLDPDQLSDRQLRQLIQPFLF
jgi:DNA primase